MAYTLLGVALSNSTSYRLEVKGILLPSQIYCWIELQNFFSYANADSLFFFWISCKKQFTKITEEEEQNKFYWISAGFFVYCSQIESQSIFIFQHRVWHSWNESGVYCGREEHKYWYKLCNERFLWKLLRKALKSFLLL